MSPWIRVLARAAFCLIAAWHLTGCAAHGDVKEDKSPQSNQSGDSVARASSTGPAAAPRPWLNPASGDTPPRAPAAAAKAATVGELYDSILASAWAGDSNALGAMFGYEDPGFFTGAAAIQHHRVLLALLSRLGDSTYAAALVREGDRTHDRVVRALRAAAGADADRLARANPRTFASVTTK